MNPRHIHHAEHPASAGSPQGLTIYRLRQDLEEPIQAAVTLAGRLLELAEDPNRPPDLVLDIRRVRDSGQGLLELVKVAAAASEEQLRAQRHGLLNALNHLMGWCQLLLQRDKEEGFGAFLEDFQQILQLCQEFHHKLTFHSPAPSDTAERPRPLKPPVPPCLRAKPGSLLIVDDSPSARELLCRLLKPHGHEVAEAQDGSQALEMMKGHTFDLVLLDILMPGVDGFEVLQRLKAQPDMPQSAVIVISGIEDTRNAIHCIELGADDYLTKPIVNQLLQARVNSCLYKRQLHLRELEQFFPAPVARQLLYKPELLHEGREAEVTVLFCDIRGFSQISEQLGPNKLIKWLSAVMEVLSECVLRHHGVLVDFQGDEVLAMWGAPEEQEGHAQLACGVALEMLAKVQELDSVWRPIIGSATEVSIGINSGPARVGNTGSRRKFKYGPLGNTVNLGSRVQGATKYLKTNLLISGDTRRLLGEHFAVRRLGTIKVININKPVDLYDVLQPEQAHDRYAKHYEEALHLFEDRKIKEAAEILGRLITEKGAQGPELWLLSRTIECLLDPNKWKRVWELPGK